MKYPRRTDNRRAKIGFPTEHLVDWSDVLTIYQAALRQHCIKGFALRKNTQVSNQAA